MKLLKSNNGGSLELQLKMLEMLFWYTLHSVLIIIIIIIIVIKIIYIAQVRKGHKCTMSAEMAVWLRNCLCLHSCLHN